VKCLCFSYWQRPHETDAFAIAAFSACRAEFHKGNPFNKAGSAPRYKDKGAFGYFFKNVRCPAKAGKEMPGPDDPMMIIFKH
jgi:hypothetical protein